MELRGKIQFFNFRHPPCDMDLVLSCPSAGTSGEECLAPSLPGAVLLPACPASSINQIYLGSCLIL